MRTVTVDPRLAKLRRDYPYTARLLCCRADPTGHYVVAGATDGTVQRWEVLTGERVSLAGHENWVRSVAFSPDGRLLYSGGYDGRLLCWDVLSGSVPPVRSVQAHRGWLRCLAVSADGAWVASCGNDSLVKIWSAADGSLVREFSGHVDLPYCLQFVPGAGELVSGDIRGNVLHWRMVDGEVLRKFDAGAMFSHVGDIAPFGGAIGLSFSPDVGRVTVSGLHKVSNAPAGNRRGVAMSFDWVTGEKLPLQECRQKDLDATMWRAVYHPSGFMIGVLEKEIGFWQPGAEDVFHLLTTPDHIFDCDLHPAGTDLFTAHFDGHLRCWQMRG
ncbi:MAG: WD40 repeat domain-containing protein [Planctomyces sp.]|jgi:hypothetical protein|nr:hypothetical protein LBMAG46_27680 [Planctomycetia bacterium]